MFQNRIKDTDALKAKIDAHRPLSPQEALQLKEYFRIGLTYTSNAIEGNSLTETETKVIIEDGLTIGGKSLREHFEVTGHSKAYDVMWDLAGKKTITEKNICELHHCFYEKIDPLHAGSYRKERVFISGTDYKFPDPESVPDLMKDFGKNIPLLEKKHHPVEYAALLHLDFVTIHPFVDGNGRTARLLMNLSLLQHGYVITIIPPIMRKDYLVSLREANKGNQEPFITFISEMVYESHKEYLRMIE